MMLINQKLDQIFYTIFLKTVFNQDICNVIPGFQGILSKDSSVYRMKIEHETVTVNLRYFSFLKDRRSHSSEIKTNINQDAQIMSNVWSK